MAYEQEITRLSKEQYNKTEQRESDLYIRNNVAGILIGTSKNTKKNEVVND